MNENDVLIRKAIEECQMIMGKRIRGQKMMMATRSNNNNNPEAIHSLPSLKCIGFTHNASLKIWITSIFGRQGIFSLSLIVFIGYWWWNFLLNEHSCLYTLLLLYILYIFRGWIHSFFRCFVSREQIGEEFWAFVMTWDLILVDIINRSFSD